MVENVETRQQGCRRDRGGLPVGGTFEQDASEAVADAHGCRSLQQEGLPLVGDFDGSFDGDAAAADGTPLSGTSLE